MSKEIQVSTTLLEKMAVFAQNATPLIEKTASEKQAFDAAVPSLVDSMINAGVLNQANRDSAIKNLSEGGLAKCAELITFLSSKVQAPSMGRSHGEAKVEKTASYSERRTSQRESDRVWEEGMLK